MPNLWNDELTTSSVIVAQAHRSAARAADAAAAGRAARTRWARWKSFRSFDTKFTKKSELSTFMLIYNAKTDSAEQAGRQRRVQLLREAGRAAEKFFNKTNPQNLNAQTLPPQFDFAAGHQLQSGQAVPLASFPEGDYRLEIKVTDKLANKTLTREVNFSVSGS